jgi:hypothetical protein
MNNLPHEIILHHIATTSSIFNALRASMPDFARYCEKNRASYWNLRAKMRVFPAHTGGKCGCYYCYNIIKNSNEYTFKYGNYIKVSEYVYPNKNNLILQVWKNRVKVWTVNGILHRDYGFAIKVKGKYYIQYRLGKGLQNSEYNEQLYNFVDINEVLDYQKSVLDNDEINDDNPFTESCMHHYIRQH